MAPRYIGDLLQPYTPTRQLRSSSKKFACNTEVEPQVYGDRSFQLLHPDFGTPSPMTLDQPRTFMFFKPNKFKTLYHLSTPLSARQHFFILLPLYIFSFRRSKCKTVHIFLNYLANFNNSNVFSFQNYDYYHSVGHCGEFSGLKWRIWRAKILTSGWKDTGLTNSFKDVLALLPQFLRENN